jgi:hypothetical protein
MNGIKARKKCGIFRLRSWGCVDDQRGDGSAAHDPTHEAIAGNGSVLFLREKSTTEMLRDPAMVSTEAKGWYDRDEHDEY